MGDGSCEVVAGLLAAVDRGCPHSEDVGSAEAPGDLVDARMRDAHEIRDVAQRQAVAMRLDDRPVALDVASSTILPRRRSRRAVSGPTAGVSLKLVGRRGVMNED